MATTPAPLHPQSTIDEILHGLVTLGIVAASIFVKNENSRARAGQIINTTNQVVLPLADQLLNPGQPVLPPQ